MDWKTFAVITAVMLAAFGAFTVTVWRNENTARMAINVQAAEIQFKYRPTTTPAPQMREEKVREEK